MSFRDMLFWFFLTLFGTGTYVIYGSQSVAGEAWGVAMIVGGFIGMVGCAWPHLKDPVSGKIQITRNRLKAIKHGKAISVVLAVVLLGSSGVWSFEVYRHFHSVKKANVVLQPSASTLPPPQTGPTITSDRPTTTPTSQEHIKRKPSAPARPGRTTVEGSDNTEVGVGPLPPIKGNGNTIVGPTDADGNTIITQPGTAIGTRANAGSNGIAIGAHANAALQPTAPSARDEVAVALGNVETMNNNWNHNVNHVLAEIQYAQGTGGVISDNLKDLVTEQLKSLDENVQKQWREIYPQIDRAHADAIHRMTVPFPGEHPLSPDEITEDQREFAGACQRAGTVTHLLVLVQQHITDQARFSTLIAYLENLHKHLGQYSENAVP